MLLLRIEMESILRGAFVFLASQGYPNRDYTPIGSLSASGPEENVGEMAARMHQYFWKLFHSTTVILYKNDRSFRDYTLRNAAGHFLVHPRL